MMFEREKKGAILVNFERVDGLGSNCAVSVSKGRNGKLSNLKNALSLSPSHISAQRNRSLDTV
jgi:hypothetical protein